MDEDPEPLLASKSPTDGQDQLSRGSLSSPKPSLREGFLEVVTVLVWHKYVWATTRLPGQTSGGEAQGSRGTSGCFCACAAGRSPHHRQARSSELLL